MSIRVACIAFVLLVCPLATSAPARDAERPLRHEFTHPALGRVFRIVVYCTDHRAAANAEAIIIRRLAELEEVFDEDRPSSEISQVYANAGLGSVRISNDLFALLQCANNLGQGRDGGFDPTAGFGAQLWRQSIAAETLPSPEQLEQARKLSGRDKCRLDPINRTVRLTQAGMRLDLDGIVTGYVCDLLLDALQQAGLSRAMIDSGRRIAVGEPPPGRKGWRIQIDDAPPKSDYQFVTLARQAIASSGRVADTVRINGTEYSRLFHPLAGLGSQNLAAVTVVARRAWQADALARTAAVLGPTQGQARIQATPNVKAWFHYPPGQEPLPQSNPTTRPAKRTRRAVAG